MNSIVGILVPILVVAFFIAAGWKLFTKAGQPGWASIIPFYNTVVLLRIVGRPAWWFVLMLIPLVNLVILIIVANDLSGSFGKSTGFTVGLILLPIIFYPILAYGSAQYRGPVASSIGSPALA